MSRNRLGRWIWPLTLLVALVSPTPTSRSSTASSDSTSSSVPPASSVRFAVIGDYGSAGPPEQDVASLVTSWNPALILTTGDNNYPLGSAATIDQNIGQYYHAFIYPYTGGYGDGGTTNRFFPVLGNHDWYTAGATPYLDYFTLPGNERYYDFTWGPVHFFAIDSDPNEPDGISATSTQAAWLKSRLAASSATWKLVYMHHAPYSSGAHGSIPALQWPYHTWGATAVLAGHDHDYERILVNSLPYFVNGLGGHSVRPFDPGGVPVAGSQVRYAGDFGAMGVEATTTSIIFQFFTRTLGTPPIDTYTITATSLVDALLPTSRSVMVGGKATAFATVINAGATTALGINLHAVSPPPGTFAYRQTNCATNALIGPPNPTLNLAAGGRLCYLLSFAPSAPFAATDVQVKAQARNAAATALFPGVNTWTLRATTSPGPDIIALTTTSDFHVMSCSETGVFAVALSNVGAAASQITAMADTGGAALPLDITVLETDPATGAVIGDNVLDSLPMGANRSVAVFVRFNGCVAFDPAARRIFVRFLDPWGSLVGSTSTAVSTNR